MLTFHAQWLSGGIARIVELNTTQFATAHTTAGGTTPLLDILNATQIATLLLTCIARPIKIEIIVDFVASPVKLCMG